ncbi:MAG: transporter [Gammaproteobacteria bacterium]|nr:transporter [Gammaproteobacteria bacterium]
MTVEETGVGLVAAALALGLGVSAEARDGALTLQQTRLDLTVGRFEGEYGLEETTRYDVVAAGLRWYFPRFELQVSVPFVSLEGPGDIRLIGGQPVPGFGGFQPGAPFRPPGLPGLPGGAPEPPPPEEIVETRRESGLGDISLQGEVYLLEGSEIAPWVIGLVRIKTPTGDEDRGLGTGKTDFELGVSLIQSFGRTSLFADAGYTWIGKDDEAALRDVVRLGVGVSLALDAGSRHAISMYFENRVNAVRGLEDQRTLAGSVSTRFGDEQRLRLTATGFAGLSDSTEDWGATLRLGYLF